MGLGVEVAVGGWVNMPMAVLRRLATVTHGAIVPAPPDSVIRPIGSPPRVTHRTVPAGRLTFLTLARMVVKPPQAVSWDWSPIPCPLGVCPAIAAPVNAAVV